MKLTINSKEILKACQSVGVLIKPQNTMPILDNILFECKDGKLSLTADNLEIRSTESVSAIFTEEFSACVSYDLLVKILKGIPDTAVDFDFENNKLVLSYQNGHYNLPVYDAIEFPAKKEAEFDSKVKVNSLELARVLKSASQFVDDKNITNSLTGILINVDNDNFFVVGGTAACMFEEKIEIKSKETFNALLSKQSASYISGQFLEDIDIELCFTRNMIYFETENKSTSSVLIDASYPDYKRILSSCESNDKIYHVDRDSLLPAIKRMVNVVDKNHSTLRLDFTKCSLQISFNNEDLAFAAKETLPVEFDGEDFAIGFNAGFLHSVVSNCLDSIKIKMLSKSRPALIETEVIKCALAPMNIK